MSARVTETPGTVGPTPGGDLDTDAVTGAATDPGEMRSGGVSVTPGDRGGGDGWVIGAGMADVMVSDLGHHHHHHAASVAIKRPPQE